MNDKVICEANISAKISYGVILLMIVFIILSLIGLYKGAIVTSCSTIIVVIIFCVIIRNVKKSAENTYLILTNKGFEYKFKEHISEAKYRRILIPIDEVIDITISPSYYDTATGGKTILIHTTRCIFKIHWVQNAEEIIDKVTEIINYELSKTLLQETYESSSTSTGIYATCSKCGNKNTVMLIDGNTFGTDYCRYCGTKLNWDGKK